MPGRDTTFKTTYRYGFNGKEMDNETYGQGNEYDYGMRVYNPRIGRFLSVDPLTIKFSWYTPYQFAGNKPIWATDLDGAEENSQSTYVKPSTTFIQNNNVYSIDLKTYDIALTSHTTFGDPKAALTYNSNTITIGTSQFTLPQGVSVKQAYNEVIDRFFDTETGQLSDPHVASYMDLINSYDSKSAYFLRNLAIAKQNQRITNAVKQGTNTMMLVFGSVQNAYEEIDMIPPGGNDYPDYNVGALLIEEGYEYSASELRAAIYMKENGYDVILRSPKGLKGDGGTSDLLINYTISYDVYTPKTNNINRIVSAIAKKNSQAEGVILDLTHTNIKQNQLKNILKRVQNAGAKNIKDIKIIGGH